MIQLYQHFTKIVAMRALAVLLVLSLPVFPQAQSKKKARPSTPAPQAKPAPPVEFPLLSLRVEGVKNYTPEQVLAVAGVKVGEIPNKARFDAARDRLVATGAFEEVSYRYTPTPDGKGYAGVFQVTEVQPFYAVKFEDLPATADELAAVLKKSDPLFGDKIPGAVPLIQRYARALEAYLAGKGSQEEVVGRLSTEDPGQLAIVFRPRTQPPSVAEVTFQGNTVLQTTALQTAIVAAVGTLYLEKQFRVQLDLAIRPLYEARGHLRVSFPKIEVEPAKDVKGMVVTVTVQEGGVYKLEKVDLAGAPPQYLKAGGFKTEDVYDGNAVQEGRQKVEQALRKEGYIRVKSSFDRRYDDEKKTVSLVLKVEPGRQYLFGKLDVRGLDIETEPALRKLWALKEGKPFNADYPDYFLRRVREDGVFDNLGATRSEVDIDDETLTVDVTLYFRGAPPAPERRRKKSRY